jgi:hypothetical protein
MSDYAELCSDHTCGGCHRCINDRLRAQRDDYRQAWQRDLAKGREFLAERDALAARLHVALEALENARTALVLIEGPATEGERREVARRGLAAIRALAAPTPPLLDTRHPDPCRNCEAGGHLDFCDPNAGIPSPEPPDKGCVSTADGDCHGVDCMHTPAAPPAVPVPPAQLTPASCDTCGAEVMAECPGCHGVTPPAVPVPRDVDIQLAMCGHPSTCVRFEESAIRNYCTCGGHVDTHLEASQFERPLAPGTPPACKTCGDSRVVPRWKQGFTLNPYAVTTCLDCPSALREGEGGLPPGSEAAGMEPKAVPVVAAQRTEPARCAVYCGDVPDGGGNPFCSDACTAAGRSLHPHESRHDAQNESSPVTCAPWCGTPFENVAAMKPVPEAWSAVSALGVVSYDSPACRDAARPLHPTPPKEPTTP